MAKSSEQKTPSEAARREDQAIGAYVGSESLHKSRGRGVSLAVHHEQEHGSLCRDDGIGKAATPVSVQCQTLYSARREKTTALPPPPPPIPPHREGLPMHETGLQCREYE